MFALQAQRFRIATELHKSTGEIAERLDGVCNSAPPERRQCSPESLSREGLGLEVSTLIHPQLDDQDRLALSRPGSLSGNVDAASDVERASRAGVPWPVAPFLRVPKRSAPA